jgi:hypothetical protein
MEPSFKHEMGLRLAADVPVAGLEVAHVDELEPPIHPHGHDGNRLPDPPAVIEIDPAMLR